MVNKQSKNFDFILIILTAVGFAGIGLVMAFATLEHFRNTVMDAGWALTPAYDAYVLKYDGVLVPLVLFEIIMLAICIPRRFLKDNVLLGSSFAILLVSIALFILGDDILSISLLLAFSLAMQILTIYLFLARYSVLRFLKMGKTSQLGSLIAHLGILLFVIDLVLIKDTGSHMAVFWISTLLIICGFTLLFYPDILKSKRRRKGRSRIH